MRNWNSATSAISCRMISDFDSTYEELKPKIEKMYSEICEDFDSTYEELKRPLVLPRRLPAAILTLPMRNWNNSLWSHTIIIAFPFWLYLWGIETRFYRITATWTKRILTLPMRNWNTRTPPGCIYSNPFWLYLWGIETSYVQDWYPQRINILTLPMRNWNSALKRHKRRAV